jgi:hypothetical protein
MLHFLKEMRWTGIAILLLIAAGCTAQSAKSEATGIADPQIAAALQQLSPLRIQANIEKLVSFGTAGGRPCGAPQLAGSAGAGTLGATFGMCE